MYLLLFPHELIFYISSGTVRLGQRVKILGEHYTLEDEEDMTVEEVTLVGFSEARYIIEMDSVSAGNFVFLGGIDMSITKTATIADSKAHEDLYIFRPLRFNTRSTMKMAIEPLNPSELPKMLEGLRKINKTYPLAVTKAFLSLLPLCYPLFILSRFLGGGVW